MSGFFPVMMFGLPAACLAMYRAAAPDRRKEVGGLYLSLALTSLLTGVTEPIEFTFMFLAPVLYAIHAVLTGAAMVVMDALGVKLGFGFSAGLFDYLLNYGLSTRPLLLIPVGAVYALVYYGVFRRCIARFDLKTPGREPVAPAGSSAPAQGGGRAGALVAALGGAGNLETVDACTTRLRLVLADPEAVDEAALKANGSRGMVRPGGNALQVVLGPIADQVASEIRAHLQGGHSSLRGPAFDALIEALGGIANVVEGANIAGRVRMVLTDMQAVDVSALNTLAPRGWVPPEGGIVHLLIDPLPDSALDALMGSASQE